MKKLSMIGLVMSFVVTTAWANEESQSANTPSKPITSQVVPVKPLSKQQSEPPGKGVKMDYTFLSSLANDKETGISKNNFYHKFSISYRLSKDVKMGGRFAYTDNTRQSYQGSDIKLDDWDRQYSVFVSRDFQLKKYEEYPRMNIGFNSSYAERNDVFSVGLDAEYLSSLPNSIEFNIGGSVGNNFTYNKELQRLLGKSIYYSTHIGANKDIKWLDNNFNIAVQFNFSDGYLFDKKNTTGTFGKTYETTAKLTYHYNNQFDISPHVIYYTGSTEGFTFGINVAYLGGW